MIDLHISSASLIHSSSGLCSYSSNIIPSHSNHKIHCNLETKLEGIS